jgi:hypothetical protein
MAKIITAKRLQGETDKAQEYVKTHILFPSGLLGLICILTGGASLVYQFISEDYRWGAGTFLQSSGLILVGMLLGWGQTRYHRYLLREFPAHFAERMKLFSRAGPRRGKKDTSSPPLEHRGRRFVPFFYLLGASVLLTFSILATIAGGLYYLAAFLLPWAGFFWAKLFFWRGVLQQGKR